MTDIPLNKLVPSRGNVRKTGGHDRIEELAASIAAHGLLQSLVVKKTARGKFAVIAGQRRYHALSLLVGRDTIPADMPIACHVLDKEADATEIGLAENTVRVPMHPADQFEAFRELIDKGAGIADIAHRFGVSDLTVTRRLKLGRVSPVILDAYRRGELGLEQVQAFAVSDDRAAQERVYDGMGFYRSNPNAIRQALTEGEIPATDRRVRFIGLEAYEAAGGVVRRDLFDDRDAGYILDASLLDRLVREALEAQAEAVRAEGWKWVEARVDFDYGDRAEFERCYPQDVELPEAEAAELERLQSEHDEMSERRYGDDAEDDSESHPDIDAGMKLTLQRIEELQALASVWTEDSKAMAGAVLYLAHDGSLEGERGLIRPEDVPDPLPDSGEADPDSEQEAPAPSLPATLIQDLTARKTAAMRAELASQPDVALAAVTHALARGAFYRYGGDSCLKITATNRSLATPIANPDECPGLSAFEAERERWGERLPGNPEDLWTWCLGQTQDTLLDLLAVASAHTVDAVQEKSMRPDAPALLHADRLAKALQLDMGKWFTPTAANYFGRIKRTGILEALSDAGRPIRTRSWGKLKKAEFAALAEREITGTGWLPEPLRPIGTTDLSGDAESDMQAAAAA